METFEIANNDSVLGLVDEDVVVLPLMSTIANGKQIYIQVTSGTIILRASNREQINYSTEDMSLSAGNYLAISDPGDSWHVMAGIGLTGSPSPSSGFTPFGTNVVTAEDDLQLTTDDGIVLWDGSFDGDIYVPDFPTLGTQISFLITGDPGTNILKIGSNTESVTSNGYINLGQSIYQSAKAVTIEYVGGDGFFANWIQTGGEDLTGFTHIHGSLRISPRYNSAFSIGFGFYPPTVNRAIVFPDADANPVIFGSTSLSSGQSASIPINDLTTGAIILLSYKGIPVNPGSLYYVASTGSFVIHSTSGSDASTVAYGIASL